MSHVNHKDNAYKLLGVLQEYAPTSKEQAEVTLLHNGIHNDEERGEGSCVRPSRRTAIRMLAVAKSQASRPMSANTLKFQVKLPKDLGEETYWAPCGQVFINLEDNTGTLYLNWVKEPFRLFIDDRGPYKKGRKKE